MVDVHVYPVNDLRDHDTDSRDCWCNPTIDYDGDGAVVIHHSMDGREAFEEGHRQPS